MSINLSELSPQDRVLTILRAIGPQPVDEGCLARASLVGPDLIRVILTDLLREKKIREESLTTLSGTSPVHICNRYEVV